MEYIINFYDFAHNFQIAKPTAYKLYQPGACLVFENLPYTVKTVTVNEDSNKIFVKAVADYPVLYNKSL